MAQSMHMRTVIGTTNFKVELSKHFIMKKCQNSNSNVVWKTFNDLYVIKTKYAVYVPITYFIHIIALKTLKNNFSKQFYL